MLLPLGALLARHLRTFNPRWFTFHWGIQFVVGKSECLNMGLLSHYIFSYL